MSAALAATALTIATVLLLIPSVSGHRPRYGFHRSARRRAGKEQGIDAATLLDLTSALLSAGVGVEAALDRLARTVPTAEPLAGVQRGLAAGSSWERATAELAEHPELQRYCSHVGFAYATGAPSAEMLHAAAAQARAERRHEGARAAAELGVKMMLPLGTCFLPAFILLGVVPVIVGMVPDALGF